MPAAMDLRWRAGECDRARLAHPLCTAGRRHRLDHALTACRCPERFAWVMSISIDSFSEHVGATAHVALGTPRRRRSSPGSMTIVPRRPREVSGDPFVPLRATAGGENRDGRSVS